MGGFRSLSFLAFVFCFFVLVLCFPAAYRAMLSQSPPTFCFAPYVLNHSLICCCLDTLLANRRSLLPPLKNGKWQELVSLSLSRFFHKLIGTLSFSFLQTDKRQKHCCLRQHTGTNSTHSTTREKASRLFFCWSCVHSIVSPSLLPSPVCLSLPFLLCCSFAYTHHHANLFRLSFFLLALIIVMKINDVSRYIMVFIRLFFLQLALALCMQCVYACLSSSSCVLRA